VSTELSKEKPKFSKKKNVLSEEYSRERRNQRNRLYSRLLKKFRREKEKEEIEIL